MTEQMRKFEILAVTPSPGGPKPTHWIVQYRAIRNKKWVTSQLHVVARSEAAARSQAQQRVGGRS